MHKDHPTHVLTDIDGDAQEHQHQNGCLSTTRNGIAITIAIDASSNEDVDAATSQQDVADILRNHLEALPFGVTIIVGPDEQ